MAISLGNSSMSQEELFKKFPEEFLWKKYFGINSFPTKINAPYRKDDNPSLSIYVTPKGHIKFKDFGTGNCGNILNLLMIIWGTDFHQTLTRILNDNGDSVSVAKTYKNRVLKPTKISSSSDIQVKIRSWKNYDLEYWGSYGISLQWLRFGDVYPISRIFFTNSLGETKVFPAEKYAYCYVERKDDKVSLKIYQPFSKNNKWMNKHNSSVWDLWTKLPRCGKNLIITSSRKDALCIWANTGIPSVSLQGEGYIPKKHVVDQLKSRFKNIYVLYDNDFAAEENHGRIDGQKICEMFGLKQIEIPESYKTKDPSDLTQRHGKECLINLIQQLINENTTGKI